MKQLNGKAKEEFEKYVSNLEIAPYLVMLDQIPQCYLNALVIEWLDSVGLRISIIARIDDFGWIMNHNNDEMYEYRVKSRLEATEKAIEKAVEIVNQK